MGVSAQSIFSVLCSIAPYTTLNINKQKLDVSGILCTNAHLLENNSFSQCDYEFAKFICEKILKDTAFDESIFCAINHLLSVIQPDFIISSSVFDGKGNGIPSAKTIDMITEFKIPYETLKMQKKLATEDGIAVIKKTANDFGKMPDMEIEKISYGTDGERIVKAILGFDEQKGICDLFEMSEELFCDQSFLYSTNEVN